MIVYLWVNLIDIKKNSLKIDFENKVTRKFVSQISLHFHILNYNTYTSFVTFLFQLAVEVNFAFGVAVAMIKFSSFFLSPADSSRNDPCTNF